MLLTLFGSQKVWGHPTNGYFCTEIETPRACFDSDGFCEWVRGQCLYRCDIHDGLEDCGQIKSGCRWDGEFCVPVPLSIDQGLMTLDTTVEDAEVMLDMIENDAFDPPDASLRDDTLLSDSIEAAAEIVEITEAQSKSGCRIDGRGRVEPLLWVLIPLVWRRRPC